MIRFCDKEICCVLENELDWQLMADYFLDWHMDEKIYILDKAGKYIGNVNYNSLYGIMPENALQMDRVSLDGNKNIWIVKDSVILDEHIWEKGRKYFQACSGPLPVLDNEHRLICFAWNDMEANRELRMLDELMECDDALGFKNIYPETECVTIYGCNELACRFAEYLKNIGVLLKVEGELWDKLGIWDKAEIPDYRNFTVYAEGCVKTQEKIALKASVSAEFECIDRIYEQNIVNGVIADTDGTFEDLLKSLKDRKIVIVGTEREALNAYDLLLEHGLDISCFVSDKASYSGRKLFGKKILCNIEVIEQIENPVFIQAADKYSAWGFGGIDFYHYIGYRRNKSYYLLKDYTEIPNGGFLHLFRYFIKSFESKLVLTGDFWLCLKLSRILKSGNLNIRERVCYCDVLEEHVEKRPELAWIDATDVDEKDTCLLLLPGYVGRYADESESDTYREGVVKEKYLKRAAEKHLPDLIDYSVDNIAFMKKSNAAVEGVKSGLKAAKIILGSIKDHSGNVFFRGLLDNHPQISMMGYNYFNENLFYVCIRLAEEQKENILPLLWRFYEEERSLLDDDGWGETEREKFNQSMKEQLSAMNQITSQDLFIMIHSAYDSIWAKNAKKISDMVIYWEPHHLSQEMVEDYTIWLEASCMSGHIVKVVRNSCMQRGSGLKEWASKKNFQKFNLRALYMTSTYADICEKKYNIWKRMAVRFEDLKCSPEKELIRICNGLGFEWSDTLLETTNHGRKEFYGNITGFDLAPVYRTYEEYYSEFDRFRIMLIAGPWQKKYGYPYVSSLDFSRRELLELFQKEFRFEKDIFYDLLQEKAEMRNQLQKKISLDLWKVRHDEVMENKYKTEKSGMG